MLEKYQAYVPKPTNKTELKIVLEAIWDDLPQESIDRAVLAFRTRLQACSIHDHHIQNGPFQGPLHNQKIFRHRLLLLQAWFI